jgi:hypothetical protein
LRKNESKLLRAASILGLLSYKRKPRRFKLYLDDGENKETGDLCFKPDCEKDGEALYFRSDNECVLYDVSRVKILCVRDLHCG